MKKILCVISIVFLILSIYFFVIYHFKNEGNVNVEMNYLENTNVSDVNNSIWVVYWDIEGIENSLKSIEKDVHKLCYFAAYFDEDGKLFFPQKMVDVKSQIENEFKDASLESYMTVVNDKLSREGSSQLKSKTLLWEILGSDEGIDSHIRELISLAKELSFDGIEIDYEAFKGDKALWARFKIFINELTMIAENNNLKIRVLLEPHSLINKSDMPDGVEYVMMCYNLHGKFSNAGPKADYDFLNDLVGIMSFLPGTKNFALATGGFDWNKAGNIEGISSSEAEELAVKNHAEVVRDKISGALKFSYFDENRIQHEIWYADEETLLLWTEYLKIRNVRNFSIWRLHSK